LFGEQPFEDLLFWKLAVVQLPVLPLPVQKRRLVRAQPASVLL
jgi:hypothetical protein